MSNPALLTKKIYYHDTDCGGVVYYANYLKHLEEGRTEYWYSRGIDIGALAKEHIYFVVAGISVKYKSPARYMDTITVATEVARQGRSSVEFAQRILRAQTVLIEASVTLVCVNGEFKPRSLPETMRLTDA